MKSSTVRRHLPGGMVLAGLCMLLTGAGAARAEAPLALDFSIYLDSLGPCQGTGAALSGCLEEAERTVLLAFELNRRMAILEAYQQHHGTATEPARIAAYLPATTDQDVLEHAFEDMEWRISGKLEAARRGGVPADRLARYTMTPREAAGDIHTAHWPDVVAPLMAANLGLARSLEAYDDPAAPRATRARIRALAGQMLRAGRIPGAAGEVHMVTESRNPPAVAAALSAGREAIARDAFALRGILTGELGVRFGDGAVPVSLGPDTAPQGAPVPGFLGFETRAIP